MTHKAIVLKVLERAPGIPLTQEYIQQGTWVHTLNNISIPAPSVRRIVQELFKAGKIVVADRRGYRQAPRFLLAPVAPVAPAATTGQA
jgi:hypothetical protein